MIKGSFGKIKGFWITYLILFFLCSICILIPDDNDIIWLWLWTFYIPFSLILVYPYGFFTGIWVQYKLRGKTKEILFISIIYFILIFFLLRIYLFEGMLKNGILYYVDMSFYPALGSTLLFILGAFITKFIQGKKINS